MQEQANTWQRHCDDLEERDRFIIENQTLALMSDNLDDQHPPPLVDLVAMRRNYHLQVQLQSYKDKVIQMIIFLKTCKIMNVV